jgi:serine/threonine protein phosphatase 1
MKWRLCGGLETLVSYGLKPSINAGVAEQRRLAKELAKCIPKRHLEFLDSLKLSFSWGDFLFVHAGIRPGVPIRK